MRCEVTRALRNDVKRQLGDCRPSLVGVFIGVPDQRLEAHDETGAHGLQAFWEAFLEACPPGRCELGNFIAQRTFAHKRLALGFVISAEVFEHLQCLLHRRVAELTHGGLLFPVFKKRDPGIQALRSGLVQPVGFGEFDDVQFQFCTKSGGRLPAVAQLKTPVCLLHLLRRQEKVEIKQVDSDDRFIRW